MHKTKPGAPSKSPNWNNLLARGGVLALGLSALFLWLSRYAYQPEADSSPWGFAILMLVARTFGVITFGCGAALLALRAWTQGTILILGSIILPCLAFVYFGVI
jgi:hypothetical protein